MHVSPITRGYFSLACLVGMTFFSPCASTVQAADELKKSASWNWPEVSVFEVQLLSYLEQQQATDDVQEQLESFWTATEASSRGPEMLDRLIEAASLIEPRIAKLSKQLADPNQIPTAPGDLDWLTSDVPGWLQDTLRLATGRAFAQRRLYDEALETLAGLELVQVCDPASLIFYRATCEHHLLKQEQCIANVNLLLERQDELPTRFAQLAQLMLADIEPLESDSLDEVARLMRDVERRLDLGRAGKRVREQEQEIIDKLDKLIDKIEQQMQQQQNSQNSQGSGSQSQGTPMDDTKIGGGPRGAGDVDQKELDERNSWGNLPPAQRQESLQRLTEELPSHYREVIEGYFRQLAKEDR